ncbi:hypothetical protein CRUP_025074 [Coryphaenoides rupestris]|nr:hypothetical protein CRUP_025074 [Coryphaenoides rupestris]
MLWDVCTEEPTTVLMAVGWPEVPLSGLPSPFRMAVHFQRRTQPSSPDEASRVLVMFQLTLHTWELWLSNWATICISSLVGPVDVFSFLSHGSGRKFHTHLEGFQEMQLQLSLQESSCCRDHWLRFITSGAS